VTLKVEGEFRELSVGIVRASRSRRRRLDLANLNSVDALGVEKQT